jgi:hypothetical protein
VARRAPGGGPAHLPPHDDLAAPGNTGRRRSPPRLRVRTAGEGRRAEELDRAGVDRDGDRNHSDRNHSDRVEIDGLDMDRGEGGAVLLRDRDEVDAGTGAREVDEPALQSGGDVRLVPVANEPLDALLEDAELHGVE